MKNATYFTGSTTYTYRIDTERRVWYYHDIDHVKAEGGVFMRFEIKHETKAILIITFVCVMLFYLTLFMTVITIYIALVSVFFFAVGIVFGALYFIEQILCTVIIVEEERITIKRIYGKQRIALDDISSVDIEPYTRRRKPGRGASYIEHRMRMTIRLNNGKEIILTDKATVVDGMKGFVLGKRKKADDEDVPLYNAYQVIQAKLY